MRFLRKKRLRVLNSGTTPPLRPTTLIFPPSPRLATSTPQKSAAHAVDDKINFLGAIAARTALSAVRLPRD